MGKKAIKQHIIGNGNQFFCGLKNQNHIQDAFIDPEDNQLYSFDGELIDHSNMHLVCTNCLKLGLPELHNKLLNDKAIQAFRDSLPKTNRERKRLKAMNRNKRIESRKTNHSNVIYMGWNPVIDKPIMDSSRLLPLPESFQKKNEPKAMIETEEPIIELTEIIESSDTDEVIEFKDGLAVIQGFGNQYMVILKVIDSKTNIVKTESLSEWLDRESAINEAKSWAA